MADTDITPSGWTFTGNPMILNFDTFSGHKPGTVGSFKVDFDGAEVYSGRVAAPGRLNIAEILEAASSFLQEPTGDGLIKRVHTGEGLEEREYNLTVYSPEGEVLKSVWGYALPGGVPRQSFKRLKKNKADIFSERLLKHDLNFLMTIRSGWRIVVKETELYPFCFIAESDTALEGFKVKEPVKGNSITFTGIIEGIHAIDIEAIRKKFWEDYKIIPSMLDFYTGTKFSFRVVVERSDPSKERYRLKFRNSLGVFEIMEITGELSLKPEYDGGEDSTYSRYDSETDDFYTERERLERTLAVSVNTGVKNPDEIRLLMDMIGSPEVYLMDVSADPVRVIPSAENLGYRLKPESPERFTLSLELAEKDSHIMQEIINGAESRRPRVFSSQFSKQFN